MSDMVTHIELFELIKQEVEWNKYADQVEMYPMISEQAPELLPLYVWVRPVWSKKAKLLVEVRMPTLDLQSRPVTQLEPEPDRDAVRFAVEEGVRGVTHAIDHLRKGGYLD